MKKISIAFSLMINFIMSVILATVTGFNVVAVVSVIFALQLLPIGAIGLGARIILTDFVGQIWGKVGSTVYKKSFYGLSRIMKPQPKNPKSISQMSVRGMFGSIYQLYQALDPAQIQAWIQLANSTPFMKKGQAYFLDTLAFFTKVNQNLKVIGEAPISDCPNWSDPAQAFDAFSLDVVTTPGTEAMKLNFSPAIAVGTKVKVFMTSKVGKRQNSIANKYRLVTVLDHSAISGVNVQSSWIVKFGAAPVSGDVIYAKFVPVNKATGKEGIPLESRAVATA